MLITQDGFDRDDAIVTLKAFISAGNYAPGDRLPPERELIGSLNMSRNTLDALNGTVRFRGTLVKVHLWPHRVALQIRAHLRS